jgi:hypothetical protein
VKKILSVIPQDDYQLSVLFDNQQEVIIDMQRKLYTVRFSELRDLKVFKAAATNGKLISWPSGLSLSVSEIMEMNPVYTQCLLGEWSNDN